MFYEDERMTYNSAYYRADAGDGPVLMIYGIDQTHWNCDKLFNVLCLYGNCDRVYLYIICILYLYIYKLWRCFLY